MQRNNQAIPGPWEVIMQPSGTVVIASSFDVDSDYPKIAIAEMSQAMTGQQQFDTAHLIKSAPDIEQALVALIEIVEILRDEVHLPRPRKAINTAYVKGILALQKSRGQIL